MVRILLRAKATRVRAVDHEICGMVRYIAPNHVSYVFDSARQREERFDCHTVVTYRKWFLTFAKQKLF